MTADLPRTLPRPVLVGGTGRSGTTVTGSLIGSHPGIWLTDPVELKFLSDPGGLADVLAAREPRPRTRRQGPLGAVRAWVTTALHGGGTGEGASATPELLADRLRTDWFPARPVGGETFGLGLARLASSEELTAAGDRFVAQFPTDAIAAARTLISRLVDAGARRHGYERWVETTPTTVRAAADLIPVLPDLQAVHVMRDGRDVISSVVLTMPWGPKDFASGLRWWESLMRRNHRSLERLPAGQGLVLQLEDLVQRDRDATVERLLTFLGLDADPQVIRWFDRHVQADQGHAGRYLRDVPREDLQAFERGYEAALARLDSAGVARPT